MRVAVIGTSGQVATELQRHAPIAGLELAPVTKIDVSVASEVGALLDSTRPRVVLNAAAYTAVDKAESDAKRAFEVNADGARHLAQWCARNDAILIHISTDYIFDGRKPAAYVETDEPNPLSVYGASKLAGEQAIVAELAAHVILRTSWVFSATGQNFVKTMLRLARERDELRVVADQKGRPTSASDIARVMLSLASRAATQSTLDWGTYHFASAGSTSWHGFAEAIVEEQEPFTRRRPKVVPISTADYSTPAVRPANSVLDTSRFESTFGLTPRPWRDGLHEVVRELASRA